ncbi:hypothetical protein BDW59DRAFT_152577 [Aspergillus cavernicola]|uniref:Uncharacterized protein n=1 Tax=Aspergillus cavernicola TaxID=176166 RepID=A0ABR4HPW3_9EURO
MQKRRTIPSYGDLRGTLNGSLCCWLGTLVALAGSGCCAMAMTSVCVMMDNCARRLMSSNHTSYCRVDS